MSVNKMMKGRRLRFRRHRCLRKDPIRGLEESQKVDRQHISPSSRHYHSLHEYLQQPNRVQCLARDIIAKNRAFSGIIRAGRK